MKDLLAPDVFSSRGIVAVSVPPVTLVLVVVSGTKFWLSTLTKRELEAKLPSSLAVKSLPSQEVSPLVLLMLAVTLSLGLAIASATAAEKPVIAALFSGSAMVTLFIVRLDVSAVMVLPDRSSAPDTLVTMRERLSTSETGYRKVCFLPKEPSAVSTADRVCPLATMRTLLPMTGSVNVTVMGTYWPQE